MKTLTPAQIELEFADIDATLAPLWAGARMLAQTARPSDNPDCVMFCEYFEHVEAQLDRARAQLMDLGFEFAQQVQKQLTY